MSDAGGRLVVMHAGATDLERTYVRGSRDHWRLLRGGRRGAAAPARGRPLRPHGPRRRRHALEPPGRGDVRLAGAAHARPPPGRDPQASEAELPPSGGLLETTAVRKDGHELEVVLTLVPVSMSQSLEFNGFLEALEIAAPRGNALVAAPAEPSHGRRVDPRRRRRAGAPRGGRAERRHDRGLPGGRRPAAAAAERRGRRCPCALSRACRRRRWPRSSRPRWVARRTSSGRSSRRPPSSRRRAPTPRPRGPRRRRRARG